MPAFVVSAQLLVRAPATDHTLGPLVGMVHGIIVARGTGKCTATARKPKPPETLGHMFASSLVGQRLIEAHTQSLTLDDPRRLHLSPRGQSFTLHLGDTAPLRDAWAQELCSTNDEVQRSVASTAIRAFTVARHDVADTRRFATLAADGLKVAAKPLRGMAPKTQDVRHGEITCVTDVWSEHHPELQLAHGARPRGFTRVQRPRLDLHVCWFLAPSAHNLKLNRLRSQSGGEPFDKNIQQLRLNALALDLTGTHTRLHRSCRGARCGRFGHI
mmetsp:Transcript_36252/g.96349  ORF Transcript_36252/g.96349 Transcript_36252/m.96349 type:complete len:272 (+) Transcript_36252:203-1018(+)